MAKIEGMLTREALARRVGEGAVDTVLVVFTDHYGRLMGKRYDAEFFLDDTLAHGSHVCDYLLTVDMEMNPIPGFKFANWERGYGDVHLIPDLGTLRMASWLDRTAMVLCDVAEESTGKPVSVAPRTILRRQLERAKQDGLEVKAASELEYYLFRDSFRDASRKGYRDLEPAGWYLEDYHALQGSREEFFNAEARRHLRRSGVPVETSKGEWGLGQHELNVRYAGALEMADRHVVFKQCLKDVADRLGASVTFMAKFAENGAGSSCHIHMSLWRGGRNAFPGKKTVGPLRASETFAHFLGGWIAHTPELMVFYAPTVNSYKRYQAGSWAPTRLAWSHDNRTAGFRVVGHDESLRIECRIPGADCNPYRAFAAALASGLAGIENKTDPPPMFEGDAYAAKSIPSVPRSLAEATSAFESSAFEHYAHFFRTEQDLYDKAVTDWERKRYFERI
jgi:glutamine synthetase